MSDLAQGACTHHENCSHTAHAGPCAACPCVKTAHPARSMHPSPRASPRTTPARPCFGVAQQASDRVVFFFMQVAFSFWSDSC